MTLQRMRHFMADHRRQPRFAYRHHEQPGKHRHFPAGQRKGVECLVVVNHGEFPLILRLVRGPGDPLPDLLDHVVNLVVLAQARLPQYPSIGAESEFQLLLFREDNELVPRCAGSAVAGGEASYAAQ